MAFTGDVTVRTKELELLHVSAKHFATPMLQRAGIGGGHWELKTYVENVTRALVYSIEGALASETLKVIDIKHAADWWEALKERWAPAWFLRRYPVQITTHHIDLKAVYPEFPLPESLSRSIRIQTYETSTRHASR